MRRGEVTKRVEYILADFERARGDDNFLYTLYVYTYYPMNCIERPEGFYINICRKMESFETIRRTRQKFNEGGHYMPRETIQKRRKAREKEMHKEHGHGETLAEIARMDQEFKKVTEVYHDNRLF